MKCPICGQQLRPGKKDPNYLLCYNCKKKFKAPAAKAEQEEREEQKYSNIPPRHVRQKRETEMRKAYDEMLSIDDGRSRKKKAQSQPKKTRRGADYEDDLYDDYYEEEKLSKDYGIEPARIEGYQTSAWILMDYGDVLVHLFQEDSRKFYSLERLWADAPRVDLSDLVTQD